MKQPNHMIIQYSYIPAFLHIYRLTWMKGRWYRENIVFTVISSLHDSVCMLSYFPSSVSTVQPNVSLEDLPSSCIRWPVETMLIFVYTSISDRTSYPRYLRTYLSRLSKFLVPQSYKFSEYFSTTKKPF